MSLKILLSIVLLMTCMLACECLDPIPFNITVGNSRSWRNEWFTSVGVNFLTDGTSGSAVYTELTELSEDFDVYSKPTLLKEYSTLGIFQFDLRSVKTTSMNAVFTFTHQFSFGIENVNPKDMCIVLVNTNTKQFESIDFKFAPFYNEITLPVKPIVYTIGVMGIQREIPTQFNVPTLVNYRASLKYDVHPNLRQYLSSFINRSLKYPSYEYVTSLVDNKIPLPSKDMVEIMSFSFAPLMPRTFQGGMVTHDFQFTFNETLGFVDKNGKSVSIDSSTLKCLYVVDVNKGYDMNKGDSTVFPGWQILACDSEIVDNEFTPYKYVTIVANLKSKPSSGVSTNPIVVVSAKKPVVNDDITPKNNSYTLSVSKCCVLLMAIIGMLLF